MNKARDFPEEAHFNFSLQNEHRKATSAISLYCPQTKALRYVSKQEAPTFLDRSKITYSDLPNNHAANLINFFGKTTYTTLLGPTLISEIFPSKPDFHLYK
jgi:hypothetical protein